MLALENHIPLRPRPRLRKHPQLPWKMREPDLDIRDVVSRPVLGDLLRTILPPIMHRFVVDPHVRRGACRAEPVDRDPGAHFVGRPGICVGPVVQLLVDPRQQGHRGVGEGVAERLRLGLLFRTVAGAFRYEPRGARETVALAAAVWCQDMLSGEDGARGSYVPTV